MLAARFRGGLRMPKQRSMMALLAFVATSVAAQSSTDVPTIEELEARIKQAEQAAVGKATLVIRTNTTCELSINGEDHGRLDAQATKRLPVDPGEQLIECVGDDRRVEQTETVEARRQLMLKLTLPPPRFERVAGGVKDNQQNLIWAERDNASDINWANATQYCASLGIGWGLPSIVNLRSMYVASAKYSVPHVLGGTTYKVKPATPLIKWTGMWYWTNEQNGSSEVWRVSLINGDRYSITVGYTDYARALCVRRS
jgi:hypothetical protein